MTSPHDGGGGGIAVVVAAEAVEHGFARAKALAQSGRRVVVAAQGETLGRRPEGVELVPIVELDVEVAPPYLAESYAAYRTLRGRDFDTVVFTDRGGVGYCALRAKQTSVAFASTAIVIDCVGPALSVEGDERPFLSKRTLGCTAAERIALELADAFVCDDETVTEWLARERWTLPLRVTDVADATTSMRTSAGVGRPLVSVVVAYHDRTAYLPLCLESLANQTYPSLEVVVADDGSTSPAALAQLDELESRTWPWPLRVAHLPHGGLGAARNGGWQAATGELVLFLDDDDVAFDGLVETLVEARTAAAADYAVAGSRFFRGDGAPNAHRGDVVRISLCEPRELGVLSNQYGGPVVLWPRALLDRLGGFSSMPMEDWDLLARAVLGGARATTPPDPLYWYRQTTGGMYSADPLAWRDAGLRQISQRFAAHLPEDARLLPRIAAGAYSELDRRKLRSMQPHRVFLDRSRLLTSRARQVRSDEGWSALARRTARFVRHTILRR